LNLLNKLTDYQNIMLNVYPEDIDHYKLVLYPASLNMVNCVLERN